MKKQKPNLNGLKHKVIKMPLFLCSHKIKSPEIWPASCKDAVVSSNQELATTIVKIKATYESIDFEISVREMDKAAIKSL